MVVHRIVAQRLGGRLFSFPLLIILLAFAAGASGCGGSATSAHVVGTPERAYTMDDVPKNHQMPMPSYVSAEMHEGYAYALAHPDHLEYIPCYCGCGLTAQHKNNLDCYIGGVDGSGVVVFDNHASFCAICVEITRDVKRLAAEGKPMQEIRAYVDETHGPKGPGTETPQPPA